MPESGKPASLLKKYFPKVLRWLMRNYPVSAVNFDEQQMPSAILAKNASFRHME